MSQSGHRGISPPMSLTRSGRFLITLASSGSCSLAPRLPLLANLRAPPGLTQLAHVFNGDLTCLLCSTGITPLHNYYEAVRPSPAHRYFGPRG